MPLHISPGNRAIANLVNEHDRLTELAAKGDAALIREAALVLARTRHEHADLAPLPIAGNVVEFKCATCGAIVAVTALEAAAGST